MEAESLHALFNFHADGLNDALSAESSAFFPAHSLQHLIANIVAADRRVERCHVAAVGFGVRRQARRLQLGVGVEVRSVARWIERHIGARIGRDVRERCAGRPLLWKVFATFSCAVTVLSLQLNTTRCQHCTTDQSSAYVGGFEALTLFARQRSQQGEFLRQRCFLDGRCGLRLWLWFDRQ